MDNELDVIESELMDEVNNEVKKEEPKKRIEDLPIENKEDLIEIPNWDLVPPFDTVDRGEL